MNIKNLPMESNLITKIKSLLEKIYGRAKKPFNLFIENLDGGYKNLKKRCLLYYKTEPFYRDINNLKINHTNNHEILAMVEILNKNGYLVDVVDRELEVFSVQDKYDLFIGCASGNSGKMFDTYAKKLTKAKKVIYCSGPEPQISNKLVKQRYDDFCNRNKIKVPYSRTSNIDFPSFVKCADSIMYIGERGQFSNNSYQDMGLPVHSILPSSANSIEYKSHWETTRRRSSYLCFAGSGLICKGVDILIEAFSDLKNLDLYICGPQEKDLEALFEAYPESLSEGSNIHYQGYVRPNSESYKELVKECSFQILNSAAEGCATSITTCLRSGLIPIANFEAGLNLKGFGIEITNSTTRVKDTIDSIKRSQLLSNKEYQMKLEATLKEARKYTIKNFSTTFEESLLKII